MRTSAGSKFLVRFDPQLERDGTLYGKAVVVGYSESMRKKLRIIGIAPEPEVDGCIVVHDKPWAIEYIDGEEVPLFEYERITMVEDLTHILEKLNEE